MAFGVVVPQWKMPSLPYVNLWCVVTVRKGRYCIVYSHEDEEPALDSYAQLCWDEPDGYHWLIVVKDVHRPGRYTPRNP